MDGSRLVSESKISPASKLTAGGGPFGMIMMHDRAAVIPPQGQMTRTMVSAKKLIYLTIKCFFNNPFRARKTARSTRPRIVTEATAMIFLWIRPVLKTCQLTCASDSCIPNCVCECTYTYANLPRFSISVEATRAYSFHPQTPKKNPKISSPAAPFIEVTRLLNVLNCFTGGPHSDEHLQCGNQKHTEVENPRHHNRHRNSPARPHAVDSRKDLICQRVVVWLC